MSSPRVRALCAGLALFALLPLAGCSRWRRQRAQAAQAARPRPAGPVFARVSPPVAFEMLRDSPDLLILDLRKPQEYNGDTGHIFRAHNIPLERLPYRLLEISPFRDETFLVYCDTRECAEEGMAILVSSGFESAVLMDGGIDGWIRKGFRTVLPSDAAGHAAERDAKRKGAGVSVNPPPPPGTAPTGPPPPR